MTMSSNFTNFQQQSALRFLTLGHCRDTREASVVAAGVKIGHLRARVRVERGAPPSRSFPPSARARPFRIDD